MRKRKGFYSISVVAKMFSVHQQTVRMYEKQGLISPKRSDGNTRLFSEEDVERLEEVIYLTHKLGVNLAGVEIILKLQKKMKRMQEDMNKMFTETDSEFEIEKKQIQGDMKQNIERLASIKQENTGVIPKKQKLLPVSDVSEKKSIQTTLDLDDEDVVIDDFKIEYDKD
jgi:MerR family transcriptional regulator/heat shock protein HspR